MPHCTSGCQLLHWPSGCHPIDGCTFLCGIAPVTCCSALHFDLLRCSSGCKLRCCRVVVSCCTALLVVNHGIAGLMVHCCTALLLVSTCCTAFLLSAAAPQPCLSIAALLGVNDCSELLVLSCRTALRANNCGTVLLLVTCCTAFRFVSHCCSIGALAGVAVRPYNAQLAAALAWACELQSEVHFFKLDKASKLA